jgi:hypothetical protein
MVRVRFSKSQQRTRNLKGSIRAPKRKKGARQFIVVAQVHSVWCTAKKIITRRRERWAKMGEDLTLM